MLTRDKKFFKAFSTLLFLAVAFLLIFIVLLTREVENPLPIREVDADDVPEFVTGSQEESHELHQTDTDGILPGYMLESPYAAPRSISFYDEFGNEYDLSDYKGNFVILYFWASWCVGCNQELMGLQHLNGELELEKIHDLEILPISIDQKSVYELNIFYKSVGVDTLHVFHDPDHSLKNAFDVRSLPSTFLIDKKGNVIAKINDHLDWNNEQISHELMTLKGEDRSFEKGQSLLKKKQRYKESQENSDKLDSNDIINSLQKKTKIIK